MVDILVRNVDEDTARRLKQKAVSNGTSVNEAARAAFAFYVKPDKSEAWAEIDRIRARNKRITGDSTSDIRDDRDNGERYR